MTRIVVVNRTRGTVLGERIRMTDDLFGRMRGFLFRREPVEGEGLLLSPCKAVHMIGMRFALDVVFIDEKGTVVAVHPDLRPWRWTPVHRHAMHALELPAGTILRTETRTGDALSWTPEGTASEELERPPPARTEETTLRTRRPA